MENELKNFQTVRERKKEGPQEKNYRGQAPPRFKEPSKEKTEGDCRPEDESEERPKRGR